MDTLNPPAANSIAQPRPIRPLKQSKRNEIRVNFLSVHFCQINLRCVLPWRQKVCLLLFHDCCVWLAFVNNCRKDILAHSCSYFPFAMVAFFRVSVDNTTPKWLGNFLVFFMTLVDTKYLPTMAILPFRESIVEPLLKTDLVPFQIRPKASKVPVDLSPKR